MLAGSISRGGSRSATTGLPGEVQTAISAVLSAVTRASLSGGK